MSTPSSSRKKKNLKGISDDAMAILENFNADGSREFNMDDFEALVDAGDEDEKMLIAKKLCKTGQNRKSTGPGAHYCLNMIERRFNDIDKKLDDLTIDEDMTLGEVVQASNKMNEVIEFLKLKKQLSLDEEAEANLKPLIVWFKKNKTSRAKNLATQKIKNLEFHIGELKTRIDAESIEMIKKIFQDKLKKIEKELKSRNKDFFMKYGHSLNEPTLQRQSSIETIDLLENDANEDAKEAEKRQKDIWRLKMSKHKDFDGFFNMKKLKKCSYNTDYCVIGDTILNWKGVQCGDVDDKDDLLILCVTGNSLTVDERL
eukprot:g5519.t1